MLKRIFPLLIMVVVVLYVTKGYWRPKEHEVKSNFSTTFQLPVRVQRVSRGALAETVSVPAEIKALADVTVTAHLAGRIQRMLVKEGDRVASGARLIKFLGPEEGAEGFFEDLLIRAPMAGSVTKIWVDTGAEVKKDASLITLVQIDRVKAVVDLPEQYYSFLKSNVVAELRVSPYPDRVFQGRLTTIRPQIDLQSRTAYLEFSLPNQGRVLLPGMFATLEFKLTSGRAGWVLPLEAVFVQGDSSYVFVHEQGKARKRVVKVLAEGVDRVVVQGAFQGGEEVLTTRPDSLRDGDAIIVVE